MERNWELFDKLVEAISAERLAEDICKYLDMDTMNKALESIATDWEVEK